MSVFINQFDYSTAKSWMNDQQTRVLQLTVIYLVAIFGIKYVMRNRKPFDLQLPLNVWNAALALFSILGFVFLTPVFLAEIYNNGIVDSYCKIGASFTHRSAGYWTFLWMASKVPEFVDTIFIVLRKRPLMFMHWLHHILTCHFAFASYGYDNAYTVWIVWLNYGIHSAMYTYYMLRSMRIRVPPNVAQMITAAQIVQFIITHIMMAHLAYVVLVNGRSCDVTLHSYLLGAGMEITYLALWFRFYYKSYIAGGGQKYRQHQMAVNAEKVE